MDRNVMQFKYINLTQGQLHFLSNSISSDSFAHRINESAECVVNFCNGIRHQKQYFCMILYINIHAVKKLPLQHKKYLEFLTINK